MDGGNKDNMILKLFAFSILVVDRTKTGCPQRSIPTLNSVTHLLIWLFSVVLNRTACPIHATLVHNQ